MQEKQSQDSVSLEQLLRLKRYEEPKDAVWQQFEVNFNEKVLHGVAKREKRKATYFRYGGLIAALGAACVAVFTFSPAHMAVTHPVSHIASASPVTSSHPTEFANFEGFGRHYVQNTLPATAFSSASISRDHLTGNNVRYLAGNYAANSASAIVSNRVF